ncbi:MAG: hypothetical protein B7Y56_15945 [Gallionellales bacterium 35-53-114]|jgi:hypothetical protein|nr:MAG: hypothetical protein B7Y56_15945 [Gallionellales bacterium 35-53-114]HQS60042.1 contact-dependent growth inhibition system immunity protein [Gallionellaceae bacterium]
MDVSTKLYFDEDLFNFFGGYFHQDWNVDDPTWEAVIERYLSEEGHSKAELLSVKIGNILSLVTDDTLLFNIINSEFGCYYWPGSIEAMRSWLQQVIIVLCAEAANPAFKRDALKRAP